MKNKKSGFGFFISVVLAIAAISMIALKLYRRVLQKKQETIDDADESDDLIEATAEETPADAEEAVAQEVSTEESKPTAAEEQA